MCSPVTTTRDFILCCGACARCHDLIVEVSRSGRAFATSSTADAKLAGVKSVARYRRKVRSCILSFLRCCGPATDQLGRVTDRKNPANTGFLCVMVCVVCHFSRFRRGGGECPDSQCTGPLGYLPTSLSFYRITQTRQTRGEEMPIL